MSYLSGKTFFVSAGVLNLHCKRTSTFHICFVGMNKSTVYFSLAFIHVVRMFVVALSLHLSRGIDGIFLSCVYTRR